MELQPIEHLLEKYDLGKTSLVEEAKLAAFFTQSDVPEHLMHYKILFSYFSEEKYHDFSSPFKINKRQNPLKYLSIAASIALLFGLILNYNSVSTPHTQDEIFAYNQTKSALELLSNNFNKGTHQLKNLEVFTNALQKGEQNMTYLNTFNTTTNTIFKINK